MSFWNDLSNVASSVLNTASQVASVAVSVAFPETAIASSIGNLATSLVGQAVNGFASQLTQQLGCPKFIGDLLKQVASQVLGGLTQPSDPDCDQQVQQQFGGSSGCGDFVNNLVNQLLNSMKQIMDQGGDHKGCGGKGGKGGGGQVSWLQAIAQAMGEVAGKKAQDMVNDSFQLNNIQASGSDQAAQSQAALDANKINAKFQADSQEFNMFQTAFSNAMHSIGDGVSKMASKNG
ncbi:MAG TPA: hypothetical protein VMG60_09165 [Burkholderiaceae bacterium]|nr:hypothetical protein [Burkholderiaceae bacterium]